MESNEGVSPQLYFNLKQHNEKSTEPQVENQSKQRSKYKTLPHEVKRQATLMASKHGIKKAAEHFNVPPKSLKRWI